MSLAEQMGLEPEEQKFFETRGAEAPPEPAPADPEKAPAEAPEKVETPAAPEKKDEPQAPEDYRKLSENYENLKRALQETRFTQKALKDDADKHAARARQLEETFQKFVSRVVERDKPDFEQNPAEHLRLETAEIKKQLADLAESAKLSRQAQDQQSQFAQFRNTVAGLEAEFVKKTPDYQDALDYMRELRTQDLTDLGVPQEQIAQLIQRESVSIAASAMRTGKNPAEAAYAIAKRYGYKGKAAEAPKPNPEKQIAQIKAGQEAAKTLPAGTGGGEITLETLASLSDEQIDELVKDDKWWNKNIKRAR